MGPPRPSDAAAFRAPCILRAGVRLARDSETAAMLRKLRVQVRAAPKRAGRRPHTHCTARQPFCPSERTQCGGLMRARQPPASSDEDAREQASLPAEPITGCGADDNHPSTEVQLAADPVVVPTSKVRDIRAQGHKRAGATIALRRQNPNSETVFEPLKARAKRTKHVFEPTPTC